MALVQMQPYVVSELPLWLLRNKFPGEASQKAMPPMAKDWDAEWDKKRDKGVSFAEGGVGIPADGNGGSDVIVSHPLRMSGGRAKRDKSAVLKIEQAKYSRADARTPLTLATITEACARVEANFA